MKHKEAGAAPIVHLVTIRGKNVKETNFFRIVKPLLFLRAAAGRANDLKLILMCEEKLFKAETKPVLVMGTEILTLERRR